MKQEIVDYGSVAFHQIQEQDNPAFLGQECVMVVGSSSSKGKFKVLAIIPDPEESVTEVAEFYRHEHAKLFAEQNENWFMDYKKGCRRTNGVADASAGKLKTNFTR